MHSNLPLPSPTPAPASRYVPGPASSRLRLVARLAILAGAGICALALLAWPAHAAGTPAPLSIGTDLQVRKDSHPARLATPHTVDTSTIEVERCWNTP